MQSRNSILQYCNVCKSVTYHTTIFARNKHKSCICNHCRTKTLIKPLISKVDTSKQIKNKNYSTLSEVGRDLLNNHSLLRVLFFIDSFDTWTTKDLSVLSNTQYCLLANIINKFIKLKLLNRAGKGKNKNPYIYTANEKGKKASKLLNELMHLLK